MSEIQRVPFHGGYLHTVLIEDEPHVVLKPTIEGMGLSYVAQYEKLQRRSWAVVRETRTTGADGKQYLMKVVPLNTWSMLLANLDENRVAENVRPMVILYQQESADALRRYWTEGGALNPNATFEQAQRIAAQAEQQMKVLRLAQGIVHPDWLEAKTRELLARALGEAPEIDPATRPLTVGEYLAEKGVKGKRERSMRGPFGSKLKALYKRTTGREPESTERFVDGALRSVKGYTEVDRPLFDQIWQEMQ